MAARAQFDVSFPGKLPKIVGARGEIFSLNFTKIPFDPPKTRWGS